MFRCLSGGSSGAPFDHVSISFRSGQHCSDGYSDAFSFEPSDLPVLRVGRPARSVFLLILPRAHASVSHCSSSSRETAALTRARSPLRRRHSRVVAPLPHARCPCSTSPPRHAPALGHAPRLRPRHAAPPYAALRRPHRAPPFHEQRRRFAAPPHTRSPAPLPYSSRNKGCVTLPTPLDQAHSRCSRNCLLGFFFAFFPDLQGYDLYTLLQSEIPLIHHPLHTCLNISLP